MEMEDEDAIRGTVEIEAEGATSASVNHSPSPRLILAGPLEETDARAE
jgi:hypothetical protein